ncbi:MAG: hypothetical protein DLM57_10535 [Pseudonocardiales bacterium]|nr:MAG: hypothetical protein DLM57_10535 [Pseudonocardiales bacterium]
MFTLRWVPLAVGVALILAGCSSSDGQRGAATQTATRFVNAIDQHDGMAACNTLTDNARSSASGATDTPCEKAVLNVKEDSTKIVGVQIWGDDAQVRIGSDVLFLRRLDTGWRVNAAGCTPQPHAAYQCDVEG